MAHQIGRQPGRSGLRFRKGSRMLDEPVGIILGVGQVICGNCAYPLYLKTWSSKCWLCDNKVSFINSVRAPTAATRSGSRKLATERGEQWLLEISLGTAFRRVTDSLFNQPYLWALVASGGGGRSEVDALPRLQGCQANRRWRRWGSGCRITESRRAGQGLAWPSRPQGDPAALRHREIRAQESALLRQLLYP